MCNVDERRVKVIDTPQSSIDVNLTEYTHIDNTHTENNKGKMFILLL